MDFSILFSIFHDFQTGRMIESLIFLFVLWNRVKPHFKKIEDRMEGMEIAVKSLTQTMTSSFEAGEQRFSNIEKRLDAIENHPDDFEFKTLNSAKE